MTDLQEKKVVDSRVRIGVNSKPGGGQLVMV
jgi:hypothetical protein